MTGLAPWKHGQSQLTQEQWKIQDFWEEAGAYLGPKGQWPLSYSADGAVWQLSTPSKYASIIRSTREELMMLYWDAQDKGERILVPLQGKILQQAELEKKKNKWTYRSSVKLT